ncbi:hypothetical protein [Streptomyces sp. DT117]|uniref:hypothetical protein n=1 Tax=Streptomyces sp. DT117 TaxID=3393422 RepID=UPI003CEAB792
MPQNPTPAAAGDTNPTTNLAPERESEIRADLAAIPAPPWRWIGLRGGGGPQLVTDHSGRQYLLRAAKPTDHRGDELLDPETDAVVYGDLEFRDQRRGETYSLMRSGNSLAVGRTEYDPDAIIGVANPLAHWFEKSAQHATELLAEVDALRARVAELEALAETAVLVPGVIEYGTAFRATEQAPVEVHSPTESRDEAAARADRYRDMYPVVHPVQRTVHYGEWTEVTS